MIFANDVVEIEIPGKAMEAHTFAWVLKFTRYGKKEKTETKLLEIAEKLLSPNKPTCPHVNSTPKQHSIAEEHFQTEKNFTQDSTAEEHFQTEKNFSQEKKSEEHSSSEEPSPHDQWSSSENNTLSEKQSSSKTPSSHGHRASSEKHSEINTRNTTRPKKTSLN